VHSNNPGHPGPYPNPYGHPAQRPPREPMPYHPQPAGKRRRGGCLTAALTGVAVLLVLGIVGTLFGDGSGGGDGTAAGRTGSAAAGESGRRSSGGGDDAGERRKPAQPGIGDVVRDGKFAFKVTKVRKGLSQVGEGFTASTAQGQYVLVYVTVKNIGDEAQIFDDSSQRLIDAKGRRFDASSGTAAVSLKDSNAFLNQINPGNSVKGILLFDVPKDAVLTAIELHDSPFSGGVTVALR